MGGSAGAAGGDEIRNVVGFTNVIGAQGSGGGAFEIVAVNDIVFGPHASFDTSGGDGGYASHRSGGGGSGGSLVIVAGGSIVIHEGAHFASRGGNGGGSDGDEKCWRCASTMQ